MTPSKQQIVERLARATEDLVDSISYSRSFGLCISQTCGENVWDEAKEALALYRTLEGGA